MRYFLILSLCLSGLFFVGATSKPSATKEPLGPLERRVTILGWSQDGSKLVFREETTRDSDRSIRAVILNTQNGKMIKEHILEESGDGPDIVSVRENNLKVLMERDGYQPSTPTQFFIGDGKRGFLSLNGQYLFFGKFKFNPIASKRRFQTLTIHAFLTDLKTSQEWEVAQMLLESLDGENHFTIDSVGAVSLAEIQWGPKENQLAIILEEKRKDFLVNGVFLLALKNMPNLEQKTLTQAEEKKPEMPVMAPVPTPGKTPAQIAAPAFPSHSSFADYYLPEGGTAQFLEWLQGSSASPPDQTIQTMHSYYLACGNNFSSQVTLYNPSTKKILEIALAPSLDPKDLNLHWEKSTLQILYLGEVLRSIPRNEKDFEDAEKSPHAYAIQVGSYANEDTAKREVTRLCDLGLPAYYLKTAEAKSGEPRFRLRLGRFRTESKARQFAKEQVSKIYPRFIVTRF